MASIEDEKAGVAFHLIMAMVSDMSLHDRARLVRMRENMERIEKDLGAGSDRDELREAIEVLSGFIGSDPPA